MTFFDVFIWLLANPGDLNLQCFVHLLVSLTFAVRLCSRFSRLRRRSSCITKTCVSKRTLSKLSFACVVLGCTYLCVRKDFQEFTARNLSPIADGGFAQSVGAKCLAGCTLLNITAASEERVRDFEESGYSKLSWISPVIVMLLVQFGFFFYNNWSVSRFLFGWFSWSIRGQTHKIRDCVSKNCVGKICASPLEFCYCKKRIDVSFLCVCPLIDHETRHNIVKKCGSTRRFAEWIRIFLAMLWRVSWSIRGQTHKKLTSIR